MKRLLTCGILFVSLCGCGPVRSSSALADARDRLEAARQVGAEKRAPYEWTAATLYLRQAREEMGRSQYEYATAFARKASSYAEKARAVAVDVARSEKDPAARP